MDITPKLSNTAQVVRSYSATHVRVGEQDMPYPLVVCESSAETVAGAALDAAGAHSVLMQLPAEIELVMIGTGARMQHVPDALRDVFRQRGIRMEAMDSGAALRTYNVLMAEGRRVALWVLAPTS
jgi:uncharacterized protein